MVAKWGGSVASGWWEAWRGNTPPLSPPAPSLCPDGVTWTKHDGNHKARASYQGSVWGSASGARDREGAVEGGSGDGEGQTDNNQNTGL